MTRSAEQVFNELLVLRAQSGDSQSFEALYARWNRALLRYARQLTECDDAAADVVQETWFAIARGLGGLSDPACFPRWAMQIASRKSADWIRRKKLNRNLQQQLNLSQRVTEESHDSSAAERGDELREAVRRLTPDQRTLLSMIYLDGLSIPQVAEVFGVPVGTIKSRLHYTRTELKTILERGSS